VEEAARGAADDDPGPEPPPSRPAARPPRRILAFTPPARPAGASLASVRLDPLPSPPAVHATAVSPAPPLAVAPPAPPPVYSGPRSGRLIWTGALGRRGVVEIDGSRASVGTLSGSLPGGVPLTVRAWPAEFGSNGIVVFTSDAARHNRREPPNTGNGWNQTTFEWDPQRVVQLALVETPSAANDFRRLVLRYNGRKCPVIFIEWTVR
jgi:hypothetical protein